MGLELGEVGEMGEYEQKPLYEIIKELTKM